MRIYLDTSPVIYWVEKISPYFTQVDTHIKQPGVVLASSALAQMECLVRPLRVGDAALTKDYEDFFATQIAEMVPFTNAVFRRAAEIRAKHNFRTPDAIQLAAALEVACDVFLTNDAQLRRFPDISVNVVS
jgi:predicted nucleic acid-binding protein